MLAVCYRCNFCPVGLRILSTTGFRLGKCFRYARLFSILEYNFCPIHFSVNLIAMFISEMRETPGRCRYAGAMSEISGHEQVMGDSIHEYCLFVLGCQTTRVQPVKAKRSKNGDMPNVRYFAPRVFSSSVFPWLFSGEDWTETRTRYHQQLQTFAVQELLNDSSMTAYIIRSER